MPSITRYAKEFTRPLLRWFTLFGRKDLPWQHPRTPYRIWVSEIMLQQTQVKTVIPYFERFMAQFPELPALANASEEQILAAWSGLGYYSRARNLYQTAQLLLSRYQGIWPQTVEELTSLPGIGRSTAAAITSQAFNLATPILDANVKRVLCRYFLVEGHPEVKKVKTQLWELAEQCMPNDRCADYTQAIMDLGATCCTSRNPQCSHCPLQTSCLAYQHDRVALLPHKKIKKTVPTKSQQFLLIHTADKKLYLEKKPPTGIWGGLWCLPTLDLETNPLDYLQHNFGFATLVSSNAFMQFKHAFTHLHLNIHVMSLKITQTPTALPLPPKNGQWFSPEDTSQLGLPQPVQRIIKAYKQTDTCE